MKTRFDVLYDLAARLGKVDVADAELMFERLRANGCLSFDDHDGYRLSGDVDTLMACESALAGRIVAPDPAPAATDEESETMRAWLFAIDGHACSHPADGDASAV